MTTVVERIALVEKYLNEAVEGRSTRWASAGWPTTGPSPTSTWPVAPPSALDALASTIDVPETAGSVLIVCAKGDWHSLASQMMAQMLRARSYVVAFLGASTSVDHVPVLSGPTRLDESAQLLDLTAGDIAEDAFDQLRRALPEMSSYDDPQLARTREDLAFITCFVAGAPWSPNQPCSPISSVGSEPCWPTVGSRRARWKPGWTCWPRCSPRATAGRGGCWPRPAAPQRDPSGDWTLRGFFARAATAGWHTSDP